MRTRERTPGRSVTNKTTHIIEKRTLSKLLGLSLLSPLPEQRTLTSPQTTTLQNPFERTTHGDLVSHSQTIDHRRQRLAPLILLLRFTQDSCTPCTNLTHRKLRRAHPAQTILLESSCRRGPIACSSGFSVIVGYKYRHIRWRTGPSTSEGHYCDNQHIFPSTSWQNQAIYALNLFS